MSCPARYPLLVERKYVYRMWGGQRILQWLDLPPSDSPIGETWEVYETNPIRNGRLAGQSLAEAADHCGAELVGTRAIARYGPDFPLLVKFIDANDRLSIQVHPDDVYAHEHEAHTGFYGKTEAWYILDAQPGANVIHGLREEMGRDAFAQAVRTNSLEPLVRHISVEQGDAIFTPPGTLHAINEGLLLFEIQQKSDITYRVYDYGRRDPSTGTQRDLHLEQALDVLNYAPAPTPKTEPIILEGESADCSSANTRVLLFACRHFTLERWHFVQPKPCSTRPETMELYTVIKGDVVLSWAGEILPLTAGDTVIVPAALGAHTLIPQPSTCLLRAFIPDVEDDIRAPLKAKGFSDDRIARVLFEV